MNKKDTLPVGKITGVHGVKGELKFYPYGGIDGFDWKTVLIGAQGAQDSVHSYTVVRARRHKGVFLIELAGVSNVTAAKEFVGLELSVSKAELPPLSEGEYYYFDLVGMEVWSDDGRDIGRIANIFPTGSNDVLEVKGPLGEVLIPVTAESAIKVDTAGKKVTVHLLTGLLPDEK